MAASAAASVVWLTAITLLSDFGAALAAVFAAFSAVFGSDFLVVTGAFSFSGAGFAAARDDGFAFDVVAFTAAVLGAGLATVFVAALLGVFALLGGAAAAVFFTAGFAIDLLEAALVAADFAFFVVVVVFAGFFIAFAMESIPTGLLSCAE
ncbi:hypothetical protein GCM10027343_26580 [Noviherbaspirillum agri]